MDSGPNGPSCGEWTSYCPLDPLSKGSTCGTTGVDRLGNKISRGSDEGGDRGRTQRVDVDVGLGSKGPEGGDSGDLRLQEMGE